MNKPTPLAVVSDGTSVKAEPDVVLFETVMTMNHIKQVLRSRAAINESVQLCFYVCFLLTSSLAEFLCAFVLLPCCTFQKEKLLERYLSSLHDRIHGNKMVRDVTLLKDVHMCTVYW